jgi:hypothetical protein
MKLQAFGAFRCAALSMALALAATPLPGQAFSTSFYVSAGPEANGFSAATGLRVELLRTWGAYARAGLRGVTNVCESSLPPTCNYPEGGTREYAMGVMRAFGGNPWHGYLGLGGGLLSWQRERDPFVDLTAEVRRTLSQRTSIVLGINAVVAPGVERERHGNDAIVPRRNVVFPNGTLGLAVLIW